MSLRTITCVAVYDHKRRSIVAGFRTKKELERHFPDGVPLHLVVVKMKGHYLRRPSTRGKNG